jgi:hypothetical protein
MVQMVSSLNMVQNQSLTHTVLLSMRAILGMLGVKLSFKNVESLLL